MAMNYQAGSYVRSRSLQQPVGPDSNWYVVEREGHLVTEVFGPLDTFDAKYVTEYPIAMWDFGPEEIWLGSNPTGWLDPVCQTKEVEDV